MSIFLGGTGSNNELHDYEEGNWTVSLSGGSYSSQQYARYVKIGGLVFVNYYIHGVQPPNNSSSFLIYGLPFTCNGTSHGFGNFAYVGSTGMSAVNLMPIIATNNTYMYFHRQDGTSANWTNAQQRSTAYNQPHIVGAFYQTDA